MPDIASSDAARIHYEVAGTGAPMLLCNASFATLRHWQPAVASLARTYRVATWDYRGHGDSEAPDANERYSLAQVVEDLRRVHEAIAGDRPACVGGLSVGGLVSLSYALQFPERVRALLLFNTGPGFKKPEAAAAWKDMLGRAAARMEAVGLERYLEGKRARAELLGRHPDSEAAREARQAMLRSSVSGLTRFALRVAGPVPNLVDRLREIPHPCLILAGEHDLAFARASEVLAAKLPRATRVVVAHAGHQLALDNPEGFVAEVRRFVDGLEPD